MRRFALLRCLWPMLFAAQPLPAAGAGVPAVAAAADLQFALVEIAAAFRRDTGHEVRLTFGSSGNFRRQIAEGAPFELFLSADESLVDALAKDGRTEDAGVRYATGRLVLFVPTGSAWKPDARLGNLRTALEEGRIRHFAIANPEHAPYGRAARQALQATGVWDAVQPRLVLGENVAQAAQFVTTGNAQAGIVAYALTRSPVLADKGEYVVIPEDLHAPLHQRMVLVKGAGETARQFYHYLQEPAAREVLRRFGFAVPGG